MHANFYSGSPLDRLALRRDDPDDMRRLLGDPDSLFMPVWRDQHLMAGPAEGLGGLRIGMPSRAALGIELEPLARHPWVLLGLLGERAVVAVDLALLDDPASLIPSAFGRFEPLRPLALGGPPPAAGARGGGATGGGPAAARPRCRNRAAPASPARAAASSIFRAPIRW